MQGLTTYVVVFTKSSYFIFLKSTLLFKVTVCGLISRFQCGLAHFKDVSLKCLLRTNNPGYYCTCLYFAEKKNIDSGFEAGLMYLFCKEIPVFLTEITFVMIRNTVLLVQGSILCLL